MQSDATMVNSLKFKSLPWGLFNVIILKKNLLGFESSSKTDSFPKNPTYFSKPIKEEVSFTFTNCIFKIAIFYRDLIIMVLEHELG